MPKDCQESAQELARSLPEALQKRPRAPQERPRRAQVVSKSGPEGLKVDPRGARAPFQEPECDFLEFAFSPAQERDSEGSKRPRERPNSSLGGFSGPRTRPHNPRQHQTGPGQAHDSPVHAKKNQKKSSRARRGIARDGPEACRRRHRLIVGSCISSLWGLSAAPSAYCGVQVKLTFSRKWPFQLEGLAEQGPP